MNKLVRDNIPQIIRKSGRNPIVRQVEADEKIKYLAMKLQEEAAELAEALVNNSNIMEEMADLTEVVRKCKKNYTSLHLRLTR